MMCRSTCKSEALINVPAQNTKGSKTMSRNGEPPQKICVFCSCFRKFVSPAVSQTL